MEVEVVEDEVDVLEVEEVVEVVEPAAVPGKARNIVTVMPRTVVTFTKA